MKINPHLVWDYTIPPLRKQGSFFRRWYMARVLIRGGPADLRALGSGRIRRELPHLSLPKRIRDFWQWYFRK